MGSAAGVRPGGGTGLVARGDGAADAVRPRNDEEGGAVERGAGERPRPLFGGERFAPSGYGSLSPGSISRQKPTFRTRRLEETAWSVVGGGEGWEEVTPVIGTVLRRPLANLICSPGGRAFPVGGVRRLQLGP